MALQISRYLELVMWTHPHGLCSISRFKSCGEGMYVVGDRLAHLPSSSLSFSDSLELLDSASYLRNVLASPGVTGT